MHSSRLAKRCLQSSLVRPLCEPSTQHTSLIKPLSSFIYNFRNGVLSRGHTDALLTISLTYNGTQAKQSFSAVSGLPKLARCAGMNFHHTRSFYNKSSAVSGLLNLSTVQNSSTVQNFSTVQNSSTVQNACTVQSTAGRRAYYTYSHEPFHPLKRVPKWQTADEAVAVVKSGDTVFIHGAAATPLLLVEAMTKHGLDNALQNVTVCHIHTEGDAAYAKPECEGIFRSSSFFIGANCRKAVNEGRGDYTPIFLSDIPLLFHRHIITIDVALVQVSPPDKHGFCSLGTSVDCARAAIQNAKYIIGQVNPCMPRTFGDGVVHKSHFDAMVDGLAPLPEHVPKQRSQVEDTIGRLIAENLVVDGATLQMGIGNIPDAVLASLTGHKNLGIHSEMFSDGVVELVEAGCVTNTYKDMHPGKITGSFLVGTRKLFDFVDNNPFVVMCDVSFVNSVPVIAQNPKVTAINSCIEIDMTGQVVSDSIGTKMYSGVGGQMDFIRGAAVCRDGLGKPILAMPSTTNKGESKIVPFLKQGGGVVTSRAHVHYVITEYGIAYLFGKNLRQRAHELIAIAHPDHREHLEKAAFERLHCMPSP